MKVVAYLRVSTDQQAREDRFGLDTQRGIIKQYCSDNGYEIIDWYVDEGVSGVKENRPALDDILFGEIKNPPVEAVIVAKSDRVARDIKLYYYYMMLLEKRGMKLISATEEVVNDESGLGEIYKSLMLFVAAQERINIMKRTSGGRAVKASKGGHAGGANAYGYTNVDSKLVIVPKEASIVRRIFREHEQGRSLREIAGDLNIEGHKTHRGCYFSAQGIKTILDNERLYRGEYKYGKMDWVKGEHEAIL